MLKADAKLLDLRRISSQGDEMAGEVETAAMGRLRELLISLSPTAQVKLHWQPDRGIVRVDGEIRATAEIECQRCLGPMPLALVAQVHAGTAQSEALITRVDPTLDPVLVEDERLNLPAWVEDELLLSLPMIPMCQAWQGGVCPVSGIEPGA